MTTASWQVIILTTYNKYEVVRRVEKALTQKGGTDMILNQGYLIKRHSNTRQVEPYYMRLIKESELKDVMMLQESVYDALPNKEVLYKDTELGMYEDLRAGAMILGVFNSKDQLISYRYISFPKKVSHNLGHDILLPENQLEYVVHLETTVVSPDYRGNRLQSLTLAKAIDLIKPMGMNHLLCTVSPYNLFSLNNIMSAGLNIKSLKRKYADKESKGIWRFILHKDLRPQTTIFSEEYHLLKLDRIVEQKKLIEMGYIGYNLIKESQMIQYALTNDDVQPSFEFAV